MMQSIEKTCAREVCNDDMNEDEVIEDQFSTLEDDCNIEDIVEDTKLEEYISNEANEEESLFESEKMTHPLIAGYYDEIIDEEDACPSDSGIHNKLSTFQGQTMEVKPFMHCHSINNNELEVQKKRTTHPSMMKRTMAMISS